MSTAAKGRHVTAVELQSILHTAAIQVASVVPEAWDQEPGVDLFERAVPTMGSALALAANGLENGFDVGGDDDELRTLAGMAHWEIQRLIGVLAGLGVNTSAERILSILAEARRSALASLVAVEERLATHAGLETSLGHLRQAEDHRERSLRRLYSEFRREIEAVGQPDGMSLPANFIQIARRLQMLLEEESLPISERLQIRSLQRRIDTWLTGDDGWSAASGQRLWMDLSAFAELLVQTQPAV